MLTQIQLKYSTEILIAWPRHVVGLVADTRHMAEDASQNHQDSQSLEMCLSYCIVHTEYFGSFPEKPKAK